MDKKILVIGTSGSGESTLARTLSRILDIPHIELDAIYWQKYWSVNPNFRSMLAPKLSGSKWIICGNYSMVEDLTWSQATIVLWLDYPLYLILWRAFKRSVQCIHRKEKLCGDNVETVTRLLSQNSILWWVIRTYFKKKKRYHARMQQKEITPPMIRIKSPQKLPKVISSLVTIF